MLRRIFGAWVKMGGGDFVVGCVRVVRGYWLRLKLRVQSQVIIHCLLRVKLVPSIPPVQSIEYAVKK